MVNKSKNKGTAAETAVCNVFRPAFPHVERRALTGSTDKGDLTGLGPVCVEVKGGTAAEVASDGQIAVWLAETERERRNARADIGLLVVKRAKVGHANAHRWWAVFTVGDFAYLTGCPAPRVSLAPVRVHLGTAVELLRAAGYGTPLDEAVA